ncbi:MAG TPA: hypothetical protein VN370_13930 [Desulfitobacteriaceae bacterium]|jgi:hypothetical protein|nr:hypothetical protein [Desulfitobacteriaceae bacterium]
MKVLHRGDMGLEICINEFVVSNNINTKEDIPIEFLRYLRQNRLKIEDGHLVNDLFDLIEKKLNMQ